MYMLSSTSNNALQSLNVIGQVAWLDSRMTDGQEGYYWTPSADSHSQGRGLWSSTDANGLILAFSAI